MSLQDLVKHHRQCDNLFVIGGGPSVEMIDLHGLSAKKHSMIVCNTSFRLYPDALLAHHCDAKWWQARGNEVLNTFSGAITGLGWGISPFSYPKEVLKLDCSNNQIDFNDMSVVSGFNSGQHAIHIAHFFKPKRIILVGFDHTRHFDGKSHWEGSDPLSTDYKLENAWNHGMKWFKWFENNKLAAWDKFEDTRYPPQIINASPISVIKQYPKVDSIQEFL